MAGAISETEYAIAGVIDPSSLTGWRTKADKAETKKWGKKGRELIVQQYADAKANYEKVSGLYEPYKNIIGQSAVKFLRGDAVPDTSLGYTVQKSAGEKALRRKHLAEGRSDSTMAMEEFGAFYEQISRDEMARQWEKIIDANKIAQGAVQSIGGKGLAVAGATGTAAGTVAGGTADATGLLLKNASLYAAGGASTGQGVGNLGSIYA